MKFKLMTELQALPHRYPILYNVRHRNNISDICSLLLWYCDVERLSDKKKWVHNCETSEFKVLGMHIHVGIAKFLSNNVTDNLSHTEARFGNILGRKPFRWSRCYRYRNKFRPTISLIGDCYTTEIRMSQGLELRRRRRRGRHPLLGNTASEPWLICINYPIVLRFPKRKKEAERLYEAVIK